VTLAALCAPPAAATDPLYEQVCVTDNMCYGAGTCVEVACVPRGCPTISCRLEVGPDSTACATNVTIDGRTCAFHFGAGTDGPSNSFGVTAQSSNGSVRGGNLENTWISPGLEAHADVAGLNLGQFYAEAYRSDIQTEGPRGGPFGTLEPSQNHTWTQIGVAAGHHGGPAFGEDVVIVLELLDMMPESCFLRSPSGAFPGVECPSFGRYYPSMALP